jgi:hypothetical protein
MTRASHACHQASAYFSDPDLGWVRSLCNPWWDALYASPSKTNGFDTNTRNLDCVSLKKFACVVLQGKHFDTTQSYLITPLDQTGH